MPELDRFDLAQIWEVLERASFEPIVRLLGELRVVHATHPLPAEVLARLPGGVSGPASASATVPFQMPYRTWVERGGFADRLAPLPSGQEVQRWFTYMDHHGLETVHGFDLVTMALDRFNVEIGKVRLKVAGIEVPRSGARDVALIVLFLLTALLGLRLSQARKFFSKNPGISEIALRSTPGLLLADADGYGIDLLSFVIPAGTAIIVLVGSRGLADNILALALAGSIFVVGLLVAINRHHLVKEAIPS
jgi:hypothetical protein